MKAAVTRRWGTRGEAKGHWAKITADERLQLDDVEVALQVEEAVQVQPNVGPWERVMRRAYRSQAARVATTTAV